MPIRLLPLIAALLVLLLLAPLQGETEEGHAEDAPAGGQP